MIVTADTSPLCHLHWIDADWLLPHFFQKVYAPVQVAEELCADGAPETVRAWMKQPPPWLIISPNAEMVDRPLAFGRLDAGEAEVLALAIALGASLVIVDDLAARSAAR